MTAIRILVLFAVLIAVKAFGLVGVAVVLAVAGGAELARRKRKTPL
jgi:predicted DNA repair protein MutK